MFTIRSTIKTDNIKAFINESIYKNKMKQKIRLRESDLHRIIKESVRKILSEQYEYDNIDDTDIEQFNDNYTEVTVPDFCLPYLVNGDTEGYDDEELEAMQNFEKEWQGKLANGLNIGDICIPQDGKSPSFRSYNDVFGNIGCDCYRFLVPLDYKIEK